MRFFSDMAYLFGFFNPQQRYQPMHPPQEFQYHPPDSAVSVPTQGKLEQNTKSAQDLKKKDHWTHQETVLLVNEWCGYQEGFKLNNQA